MASDSSCFSPNILIYLDLCGKKIRLADVLYDTATLFDMAEVPPQTKASLVFSINGAEEREEVILHNGISKETSLISFTYANPERLNSRHFPLWPAA